jgi:hypothetical protein
MMFLEKTIRWLTEATDPAGRVYVPQYPVVTGARSVRRLGMAPGRSGVRAAQRDKVRRRNRQKHPRGC